MRRAKIIATIGPACEDEAQIDALIRAGVDVCRLNLSFGTHEEHGRKVVRIRQTATRAGKAVAVMLDLQGPKIRIGKLRSPVTVADGDEITLSGGDAHSSDTYFPTTYQDIASDTEPGKTILIADGKVVVEVVAVDSAAREVRCRVSSGGVIMTGKGINLPYTNISLPALTDKDLEDARFGVEVGVDYICLSFVRRPEDIGRLRALLADLGRPDIGVIAKIEKPEAIEFLDAILEQVDGIMVARGDLADEIPFSQVPAQQKKMLHRANQMGKLTIIATEMLGSMVEQPLPSRAETSDVANGILDGTDCVMLSNETATGKHPARTVKVMAQIVEDTENAFGELHACRQLHLPESHKLNEALCETAAELSHILDERAIAVFTHSGKTVRILSKYRPQSTIYGVTFDERVFNRMAFYHNVRPVLLDHSILKSDDVTAGSLDLLLAILLGEGLIAVGDKVIFLTGDIGALGWKVNTIKVMEAGK